MSPWPLTSPMGTRLPCGTGTVLLLRVRLNVVSWRVVSLRRVASRKASAGEAEEAGLPAAWRSAWAEAIVGRVAVAPNAANEATNSRRSMVRPECLSPAGRSTGTTPQHHRSAGIRIAWCRSGFNGPGPIRIRVGQSPPDLVNHQRFGAIEAPSGTRGVAEPELGWSRSFFGPTHRLSGSLSHPCPKPTYVPNRCSLKPLAAETPEKALLLVCPPRCLTLQVVWRSRPRFQLPNPSSRTRWPAQAPRHRSPDAFGQCPPGENCCPGYRALVNTPGQAKKTIQIHRQTASGRRIYSH
jgi:hypothetical protein